MSFDAMTDLDAVFVLYRFRLVFCKVKVIILEAMANGWASRCKLRKIKMYIH